MLKCNQPQGREWANLPPKGPQTRLAPGGRLISYDNNDDDDFDDDDGDYDVFSSSQRT